MKNSYISLFIVSLCTVSVSLQATNPIHSTSPSQQIQHIPNPVPLNFQPLPDLLGHLPPVQPRLVRQNAIVNAPLNPPPAPRAARTQRVVLNNNGARRNLLAQFQAINVPLAQQQTAAMFAAHNPMIQLDDELEAAAALAANNRLVQLLVPAQPLPQQIIFAQPQPMDIEDHHFDSDSE